MTENQRSPKGIRPKPDVLEPIRSPWEPLKLGMRWETISRRLTEFDFYTHPSFPIFFKCLQTTGRDGGAFKSCAITKGIVPERQFVFRLLESFVYSFYICIHL